MALEQKYNDEQHTSTDVSVSPTNEREKEMQTTTSDGETETQEFFWDALMVAVVQNEPKRVRSLLKRSDPNRKSPVRLPPPPLPLPLIFVFLKIIPLTQQQKHRMETHHCILLRLRPLRP